MTNEWTAERDGPGTMITDGSGGYWIPDYPPGSFGAEMDRLERELNTMPLPWYLWPLRSRVRRRIQETREDMRLRQTAALERLLAAGSFVGPELIAPPGVPIKRREQL